MAGAARLTLVVGLVLTATWAVAPARAADPTAAPNVVLIVTDDQRWDSLWAMPNVRSELVDRGVTFRNAFVVNALCCPSRASILTGDYSHTTGVYRQIPPHGRFESLRDRSTLATWLDDAGYETALVGKYIDGYQHAGLGGYVPPGWDHWAAFIHAGYYDYALSVDGRVRTFGSAPDDYSTDVLVQTAVNVIEDASGPLFLYFAPEAPHAPAIPAPGDATAFADLAPYRPPSYDEPDVSDKPAWVRALPRLTSERSAAIDTFHRDQLRSLLAVDRAVGAIVGALRRTGRLRDTLIVYTTDNGIAYGEHRWTKKETAYEESIRIPLVVRYDALAAPHTDPRIVLNIDIAPSVADVAGLPGRATDGVSFVGFVRGADGGGRAAFLIEHLRGTNPIPTYCAVRTRGSLYVRSVDGEEELYDLAADPFELRNVAGAPSAGALREELRFRLAELCDPRPPGWGGRIAPGIPVASLILSGLLLLEALAGRRRTGRRVGRGAPRTRT